MKTLKMKVLLASLATVMILSSCKKVVLDAGDLISQNRELEGEFSQIDIQGSLDLYLNQDSDPLRIEAGENIMNHIETYVQNDVLYIQEESNNFLTSKPIRVYVNSLWLEKIKTKGSGNIEATQLSSDSFDLDMDGSGDVDISFSSVSSLNIDLGGSGDCRVSGMASSIQIGVNGSGDVNAKLFESQIGVVNVNGSGDVDVYANQSLLVNINGSGDVNFWGNPSETTFNTNGSGNINQIN